MGSRAVGDVSVTFSVTPSSSLSPKKKSRDAPRALTKLAATVALRRDARPDFFPRDVPRVSRSSRWKSSDPALFSVSTRTTSSSTPSARSGCVSIHRNTDARWRWNRSKISVGANPRLSSCEATDPLSPSTSAPDPAARSFEAPPSVASVNAWFTRMYACAVKSVCAPRRVSAAGGVLQCRYARCACNEHAAFCAPSRTAVASHRRSVGRTRSSSATRSLCAACSSGRAAAAGQRTPRAPEPPAHPPGPGPVSSVGDDSSSSSGSSASSSVSKTSSSFWNSSGKSASFPQPLSTSRNRMNACMRVMSRAEYSSAAETGASCLPVSSSSDIARMSSAASTSGAGAFPSSCRSRPAGVAMCAREGAGMHAGTSTLPGGCHGPGSKKHASKTPWISGCPSARTRWASAKCRSTSGTRRYGAVRYVSRSSDSDGLRSPSKVGRLVKCSTSSSVSTRLPARLLGLPPEGGHRGRASPAPNRDARKPPPSALRHPLPAPPWSPASPSFQGCTSSFLAKACAW